MISPVRSMLPAALLMLMHTYHVQVHVLIRNWYVTFVRATAMGLSCVADDGTGH